VLGDIKSVVERLRNLENERKNLMLEIDELRKMADSKATALESEVSMLREEVRSLRLLLGAEELDPPAIEDPQQKKKPRK
jgi:regulator of replication initiation timing